MAVTGPLFLGLISGTSADGIDAALVRFEPAVEVVAATTTPYPADLRRHLLALTAPGATIPLDDYGALDVAVGASFATAVCELLQRVGIPASAVRAIGSHGQTVRHGPQGPHPFTLQIGAPAVIAERTGIATVADFRCADVAAGGQGAPLMPAFHAAMFGRAGEVGAVLNIGGIANVTVLGADGSVLGFDTGPGNCLLDVWAERQLGLACDRDGAFARTGRVDARLLARLLGDRYFDLPPPKSTGREHFNAAWLDVGIASHSGAPADVQATLVALTARTVAAALRQHAAAAREVLVCGGGVHNPALMAALGAALAPCPVRSTAELGIDPDYVEAAGFAWLARERLAGRPGNLPAVTGARGPRLLGAVWPAGGLP